MDGIVLDRIKSLLAGRLADLAARLRAALARIETGRFRLLHRMRRGDCCGAA
jgi:hypothetical protein